MSKKFTIIFSLILVFLPLQNSFADSGLIRDAETEKFLHNLADPIFKVAGLDPRNIKIYIINDDSINAFVSGGQNVFINTGLIRKYSTPDALIGVIAHETGHIVGGHLARSSEGAADAEHAMFLSYLLGIGAILGGSPDAGSALIMGGSQSAQRLYMKFTRTQEEAADNYAVNFLDKLSYPATGLVKLLQFFESEMIGYKDQVDEFLLSHPVSQKRIDLIIARTKDKNFSDEKINHKLQKPMERVLVKLEGFIDNPDYVLKKYQNQNDENANYAKAIAFFRKGKIKEALELLDPIIAKNPKDGFLFELKGQILFESGNIQDSILAYNRAIKLLSGADSSGAKIAFSAAILELKTHDSDLLNLAIRQLEEAKKYEDENPFLLRELAQAYSKNGDEARSLLALAEFNLLLGEKKKAEKYAQEAKGKFKKSDKVELLRADDLLDLTKDDKEKDKEKK